MSGIFICTHDNDCPPDIADAGRSGKLQVHSMIGWIDISSDEFSGVINGCKYRINSILAKIQTGDLPVS